MAKWGKYGNICGSYEIVLVFCLKLNVIKYNFKWKTIEITKESVISQVHSLPHKHINY